MGLSSWRGAIAPASLLAASLALLGLITLPIDSPAAAAEPGAVVMTVTGDIDGCEKGEEVAGLVAQTSGPFATVGDHAYPEGSTEGFARCYDPSWGRFKDRTRPTPGNHDYDASRAAPYYEYFGAAAGQPGKGWYSYNVGAWHVVALNSNCDYVDCDEESEWLRSDLAAHPSACILAYWHHPRFASGTSGGDSAVGAFWNVLYDHGASVVLGGHDHVYERFAPQNPSGRRDPERGIRQFIVGTGGASMGSFAGTAANSEVRSNRSYGVLELTLRPGGYDWRFVSVAGDSFTDSGTDTCRGTAPAAQAPPAPEAPAAPPEPETPETPEPPTTVSSGPSAGPRPTAPAPGNPRRQQRTRPMTPADFPAPRAGTPARSVPATRPASVPTTASSVITSTAPVTEPGPAPEAPAAESLLGTTVQPPATAEPDGAADSTTLALAISGLITEPQPSQAPDRRGATGVAIGLMAANCTALAALHRRGRGIFSG